MISPSRSLKTLTVHDETDTEGSWAVSYGDMITLLLTFFIVFFSLNPREMQDQNMSLKFSLIETLNSKSAAQPLTYDSMTAGKENEEGLDPAVLKEWNGVAHDRGQYVIVEFPHTSFFNSGKLEITKEGIKELERFVQVYTPYAGNYIVSIRAFTDYKKVLNLPHLRFKDNLELSALRSVATMRILQKSGIPLSRMKLGGWGELLITANDLAQIPIEKRGVNAELALARKVVLVIEPEVKNEVP